MKVSDYLATVSLFRGLPEKQLDELAPAVSIRRVRRGERIFSEGDKGTGFYVVLEGQVKIFKVGMDGKEQIIHVFDNGQVFAEVALFENSVFPAHAQAMKDSKLLFVPKATFSEVIKTDPALAMNMMATLCMRLRQLVNMIESLSLKEVPGRLAAYLIHLVHEQENRSNVRLDISKTALASILGTIPETLSRVLKKMARRGLIKIDGPDITILDLESLEELASGDMKLV